MSRTLSPAALRSILSPNSDSTLFTLLTLSNGGLDAPIKISDGYTTRLTEFDTESDAVYGIRCGIYASYNTTFTVTVAGTGYSEGDLVIVPGNLLGGVAVTNNLNFTVKTINGSGGITALEFAASAGNKVAAAASISNTSLINGIGTTGAGALVTVNTVTTLVGNYIFLPIEVTLPGEDSQSLPQASITIYDVTQIVMPKLRELTGPPDVTLQIVLSTTPDILEADFYGLKLSSVTYNKDTITAQLTVESLEQEPFPSHTFLPSTFPGLF